MKSTRIAVFLAVAIALHMFGGLNTYSYASDNPFANTDPHGLDFQVYTLAGGHYFVEFYTSHGYVRYEFAPVTPVSEAVVIASLGILPVSGTITEEPNNEELAVQVPGLGINISKESGDQLATILDLLKGQQFTYDLYGLGIGDNCLTFALRVRDLAKILKARELTH